MSAPASGMSLLQIRTELNEQRFGPNMDSSLSRWIRLREGMIWSDSEWPFKRVRRSALSASTATPTMPSAHWKTVSLERSDGVEVTYMRPVDFNRAYPTNDSSTGGPDAYTVLNGQIILGPTPSGSISLYHSYDRRPSHYNDSDVLTVGTMTLDTDYPVYPAEYHYVLVAGAMASGLKVQNDPTWDALEQEFQQLLNLMREDLLPPDQYSTNQYGRDGL